MKLFGEMSSSMVSILAAMAAAASSANKQNGIPSPSGPLPSFSSSELTNNIAAAYNKYNSMCQQQMYTASLAKYMAMYYNNNKQSESAGSSQPSSTNKETSSNNSNKRFHPYVKNSTSQSGLTIKTKSPLNNSMSPDSTKSQSPLTKTNNETISSSVVEAPLPPLPTSSSSLPLDIDTSHNDKRRRTTSSSAHSSSLSLDLLNDDDDDDVDLSPNRFHEQQDEYEEASN